MDKNRVAALRKKLGSLASLPRGGRVAWLASRLDELLKASIGDGDVVIFPVDLDALEAAVNELESIAIHEQNRELREHLIEKQERHSALSNEDEMIAKRFDDYILEQLKAASAIHETLSKLVQKRIPGWKSRLR